MVCKICGAIQKVGLENLLVGCKIFLEVEEISYLQIHFLKSSPYSAIYNSCILCISAEEFGSDGFWLSPHIRAWVCDLKGWGQLY